MTDTPVLAAGPPTEPDYRPPVPVCAHCGDATDAWEFHPELVAEDLYADDRLAPGWVFAAEWWVDPANFDDLWSRTCSRACYLDRERTIRGGDR